MEEPAKAIAPVDVERCAALGRRPSPRKRWALRQGSTRTVPVVMLDVSPQHALKMTAVEQQQPVQALSPHTSDPALGKGVRPGARIGVRMTSVPSLRRTSSKQRSSLRRSFRHLHAYVLGRRRRLAQPRRDFKRASASMPRSCAEKDVKRTWRAKRPLQRPPKSPPRPGWKPPTCRHPQKWRDPDSNWGHHDFQGRVTGPARARKVLQIGG